MAEVRSVVHSLSREALQNASGAFPEVHKLMESRVIMMMEKREESEKTKSVKKNKRLKDATEQPPKVKFQTVAVDLFQATGLPSTVDITRAHFFCKVPPPPPSPLSLLCSALSLSLSLLSSISSRSRPSLHLHPFSSPPPSL
jgi:hypothetical protein